MCSSIGALDGGPQRHTAIYRNDNVTCLCLYSRTVICQFFFIIINHIHHFTMIFMDSQQKQQH